MTALRALIALTIAGFWFAMFAPPMFMTPPSVKTGVHLIKSSALVQPNRVRVDPGSPAFRAGLRTGDTLGCMSDRDYTLLISPSLGYDEGYRAGSPISTCVVRNGARRPVTFVADTGPPIPNSYGSDLLSAVRVLVVLVFFLTGTALVIARPNLMTWLFFAYCIGSAPSFAAGEVWTILPPWQFAIANTLTTFGTATAVSFLMLFAILVPDEKLPSGWRRVAFYLGAALVAGDLVFSAVDVIATGFTLAPSIANTIDESLTGLTVLLVIARLVTMQRAERARFGWAAFAIVWGVVTNDLRNVLSVGGLAWYSPIAADLTIVMPLCLTYAILKRHVIDVRFVISRTVVYAILTTLIVGIIGAVDWLTSAYLAQVRLAMAIDAAVTIAIAFVLHRAYNRIETSVDAVIFRRKHEATRYLERVAQTLAFAEAEEAIDRAIVHDPHDKFEITACALYRLYGVEYAAASVAGAQSAGLPRVERDHDLVRFMLSERGTISVHDLRPAVAGSFSMHGAVPAVAIPIFQGNRLTAFALYGIHRDGTTLDPDEIQALEHLCAAAAQAYTGLELARYLGGAPAPMASQPQTSLA